MRIEPLSRYALEQLVESRKGPSFSFYFPMKRSAPGSAEDRAQLESLIREAERRLEDPMLPAAKARGVLREVRALARDPGFWRHPSKGRAVFASPGFVLGLWVESPVSARLEIGDRFVVAPLLGALAPCERFYVLALSMNALRLLEVTPAGFRRLDVPGLPADMKDALGLDQYDSSLQVHSGSTGGLTRQPAIVHGHGDDDMDRLERDLRTYFRRVAAALQALPRLRPEALREAGSAIVVAAVEEHFPILREAWGGPGLVTGLAGNPDHLTDRQLTDSAREELAHWSVGELEAALEVQRELGDRHRVSREPEEIVAAADRGRVDTLLVLPGTERWGTFEPALGRIELHPAREPGDEDLVELAIWRTLAQGGRVLPLPPDRTSQGVMSAILRY